MSIGLHNLKSPAGSRHRRKRLGRGNASGHGTYSTRGQKGQRARSGGRQRLVQRGVKHFIMRMPKQRGFTSLRAQAEAVKVGALNHLPEGSVVTLQLLHSHGLIRGDHAKVIAGGQLTRRLIVQLSVSAGARAAIEAAGGKVGRPSPVWNGQTPKL